MHAEIVFGMMKLNRATQVIAAYVGEELAGVLLADIKGEKKSYRSFGKINVYPNIQSITKIIL